MENTRTCASCAPKTTLIGIVALVVGLAFGYYYGSSSVSSENTASEDEAALQAVNPFATTDRGSDEEGAITAPLEYQNPFDSQGGAVVNPFRSE